MRIAGLPIVVLLLLVVAAVADTVDSRTLAKLLGSRHAEDRARAARLLADVPGTRGTGLLLRLLADEDGGVRRRARRALVGRRGEEDLAYLARHGLGHPDARVRGACLSALADARAPGIAGYLEDALEDRDPGIREAAVGIMVNVLGGRGLPLLAAAVSRGREGRPCAGALLAVGRLSPERAIELAPGALRHEGWEARVAAVEVLGGAPPDVAVPLLQRALGDECWSVRLTAFAALTALRDRRGVPLLIEALRSERGRLEYEAGEALARLTGIGFPADPDRWAAWWEREGDRFVLPEAPPPRAAEEHGSVATFHSIPIRSDAVAFVLDRSRSMRDRIERPGHVEEITKGRLVEEELAKTLTRLAPPTRFLLVGFGTEPRVFRPRTVPATRGARAAAIEWFEKLPAAGRTNLYDALEIALSSGEVDTIFVLTDVTLHQPAQAAIDR